MIIENEIQFWLMDGRAHHSIDDAIVLAIYDTLDEAKKYINGYGADTCIVKIEEDEEDEIVDSLLWSKELRNV